MTNDLQIWEQIDRYLSGSMTAKEQELFKATMASDEQLAEMVEASQIANEVVIGHEVLKLKDQMSKDLKKPKSLGTHIGIALLLVTTMVAGGAYFINRLQEPPKDDKSSTQVQTKTIAQNDSAAGLKDQKAPEKIFQKKEVLTPSTQENVASNKKKDQKDAEKSTVKSTEVEVSTDKQIVDQEKNSAVKREETTIPKERPVPEKVDVCSGTIALTLYTSPSCVNEHTGSIHINTQTVTGGKAPYRFSVHADGDFSTSDIVGLPAGNYTIYIKDANACSYTYKQVATIHQIACRDARKEYTYHLAHDPAWKIPYQADKTAKSISIVNKAGQEVYASSVYNGSPEEWNGESNTGLQVSLGYHVYTIVYIDNTVEQGSIIIVK